MTNHLTAWILLTLITLSGSAAAENNEPAGDAAVLSDRLAQVLADAAALQKQNQVRKAIEVLQTERANLNNHPSLVALEVQLLLESGRFS
ncbi:MAG: hypothetical protein QNL18_06620, partial [Pseudomonadales bacterium]